MSRKEVDPKLEALEARDREIQKLAEHELQYGDIYPHRGGCAGCREAAVCNACGRPLPKWVRCTNGRCSTCHRFCTSGGSGAPGHGYGNPTPEQVAAARLEG
jgi:hypothetical protein